jgi:hypothetical protein
LPHTTDTARKVRAATFKSVAAYCGTLRAQVAQDWFATLADTDNDKLYEYAYEHPTDPLKNRVAYFKRETALERNAYVMDFAENRLTIGALKCVFLRLRDEKGDRVFTSQEQYQWLLDNAMGSELEEIGTAIFASERDAEMTLDDAKND